MGAALLYMIVLSMQLELLQAIQACTEMMGDPTCALGIRSTSEDLCCPPECVQVRQNMFIPFICPLKYYFIA